MNYEKEYKETIDKLRKLHNDWDSTQNRTAKEIELVFPELCESEDEKIRKDIVAAVETHGDFTQSRKEETYAWLEKQGKQEPVNKIKPKFNVRDWIVHDMSDGRKAIRQIINMTNKSYVLDGEVFNTFYFNDLENDYHLWTIKDAKDGDVLCDYSEEYDNPLIFILKKFERVNFGLVTPSDYSSYCFLTAGDIQRFEEGNYHHKHNIKPATKEQRDLLFQKMHEVGYEWDAEKNELKKIEQKSTWSKEDEEMFEEVCSSIKYAEKHRITCSEKLAKLQLDWLKSLKPNHWKPSEAQMDALRASNLYWKGTTNEVPKVDILESLYNDLQKQM